MISKSTTSLTVTLAFQIHSEDDGIDFNVYFVIFQKFKKNIVFYLVQKLPHIFHMYKIFQLEFQLLLEKSYKFLFIFFGREKKNLEKNINSFIIN